ncbi:CHAP domain-containing protein [Alloscardovia omnicolens]|uniref:CHAP domain-containing protein n=1 Tax=Alloscardovia omnicolens TaxID=419015 RepID=UPI003A609F89
MKHAGHKATTSHKRTAKHASVQASSVSSVSLEEAVIREVNAMPRTRRERREYERSRTRKTRFTTSSAVTLLLGTVGTAVASSVFATNSSLFDRTIAVAAEAEPTTGTSPLNVATTTVSRSEERTAKSDTPLSETASVTTSDLTPWNVEDGATSIDVQNLTSAPQHPTGDTGNAYPFSQCTWWAYIRRHQLGLPVGSYFGNGGQWANSARALGYSVDNVPQVGDIMVFQPGQEGSDSFYGHVAIVEKVNPDGSVVTSESGAVMNGRTYTRTISNTSRFQFIHE